MLQDGWAVRLATGVGERVRHYRGQAGLSAQKLSERCDELGHKIERAVIANIERGARQSITLAELLVLARALRVPPVALIVPLGAGEPFEVLPAELTDTWTAAKWVGGRGALDASQGEQKTAMRTLNLLAMQDEDVLALRAEAAGVRRLSRQADSETNPDLRQVRLAGAETHMRRMEQIGARIADVRRRLRAEGLDPGPLPADIELDEDDFAPEAGDGGA